MTNRKKLMIAVITLSVILFVAVASLVVVLVVGGQTSTSQVNVKFTSEYVDMRFSTGAFYKNTSFSFRTSDGLAYYDVNSDNRETTFLSGTTIELSGEFPRVVFRFGVINMMKMAGMEGTIKINITSLPAVCENIDFYYTYVSGSSISNPQINIDTNDCSTTLISAEAKGKTNGSVVNNFYVVAQISDLNKPATLSGDFELSFERATEEDYRTYNIDCTEADAVENDGVMYTDDSYKTNYQFVEWADNYKFQPTVIPLKVGRNFNGFNELNSFSSLKNMQVCNLTPNYLVGDSGLTYSYGDSGYSIVEKAITTQASTLIIPDIYNNGTNGVAPVKSIGGGDENIGILSVNNTVKTINFGRYCTIIDPYALSDSQSLESLVLPEGMTTLYFGSLFGCTNLKTLVLPSSCVEIHQFACASCPNLEVIFTNKDGWQKSADGMIYFGVGAALLSNPISGTYLSEYYWKVGNGQ